MIQLKILIRYRLNTATLFHHCPVAESDFARLTYITGDSPSTMARGKLIPYDAKPQYDVASPSDLVNPVRVASGAAADVYRGLLRGTDVAMRRPRITSLAAIDRFERELALRSCIRHSHILPLIAACASPPHYCTVSPWLDGGDLFHALHVRNQRFDFQHVLQFALQLACATHYLHQLNIVHRDIKTANILVDQTMTNAYLSDLDLAVAIDDLHLEASRANGRAMHRGPSNGRLSHMVGTLVYMAPEVLKGHPHTFAADVYAFAVTINEIAGATVPYIDRKLPVPELHTILETRFNELTLRSAIVKDNLRPVIAPDIPKRFSALIASAWHPDPTARPTFEQILHILQTINDARLPHISNATIADNTAGSNGCGEFPLSSPDAVPNVRVAAEYGQDSQSTPPDCVVPENILLQQISLCARTPPLPSWEIVCSNEYSSIPCYLPCVNGDLSSTSGARGADRMEDRSIVFEQFAGILHAHLFAVFDGHGGETCAQFAADLFPGALSHAWSQKHATPSSALTIAFQNIDQTFLCSTPASEQSGCTAIVALIYNQFLHVANAGDCRCVLGNSDGSASTLTKDHVASDPDERALVEKRGGKVDISSGRVQGRLLVSRALGDRHLKQFVTSRPDVTTVELGPHHDCIILASDGLWDVVSAPEAVSLVRTTARSPDLAAKRLALKAIEKGSKDNISVIVVFTS